MTSRVAAASLAAAVIVGCVPQAETDVDGDGGADDYDPDSGADDDAIAAIDPAALPAGDSQCREPVLVDVYWVVDGDTFYCDSADEQSIKVRVIGVDTPEVAHEDSPADCFGDEASAQTTEWIEDHKVWLTFVGDCEDPYDRLLAYVHLGTAEHDFLERRILRAGMGHVLPIEPNTTFADMFRADQAEAEDAGRGGWAACGW